MKTESLKREEIIENNLGLVHACANRWHKRPSDVYHRLQEIGCIDDYLVPHYEILHTQGTEYIVNDIEEYLQTRGASV